MPSLTQGHRTGSLALLRLWCRTSSILRSHHGYHGHQATGSSSITVSRHCTVPSLRLLYSKQSRAVSNTGYPQRFTLALTPLVSHISVTRSRYGYREHSATGSSIPSICLNWAAPSCCLRSCSLTVTNQQTSSPRYPWVTPTVHPSLSVTYRPYRAKRTPFGRLYFIAHPPTRACRPNSGRPCLPPVPGSATLRSVVRPFGAPFLSPVAHARHRRNLAAGSLDAPPFASTLAALRASRPPAIGSSFFFCFVCFCFCIIIFCCCCVPCGSLLRLRIRS